MSGAEREREIKKRRKKEPPRRSRGDYDPLRRRIVKAGLLIGAGLLAGVAGGIWFLETEKRESTESDEEIILGEAKRLGISPSSEEQSLWTSSYSNTDQYIPPTAENFTLVRDRGISTLDLMGKSKNPYFKEASEDLFKLVRSGRVKLVRLAPELDKNGPDSGIGYGVNKGGQFEYELNVSSNFVLNKSNGLTLAGILTHDVVHLRRLEQVRSTLSGLKAAEQAEGLDQYLSREQREEEEALAYGIEAQAYIYQAGLLGWLYDSARSRQDDLAVAYIRFGRDPNSHEWRNYIIKAGALHLPR